MINQIFRYLISIWRSFFPLSIIGAFGLGLCLSLVLAGCTSTQPTTSLENSTPTKAKVVRFGYQKTSILLRTKGVIEKRLSPEGISVKWIEFPAGPQLLEAMNVGSIDIGPVGESPPIFAQAAGASLIYID